MPYREKAKRAEYMRDYRLRKPSEASVNPSVNPGEANSVNPRKPVNPAGVNPVNPISDDSVNLTITVDPRYFRKTLPSDCYDNYYLGGKHG